MATSSLQATQGNTFAWLAPGAFLTFLPGHEWPDPAPARFANVG